MALQQPVESPRGAGSQRHGGRVWRHGKRHPGVVARWPSAGIGPRREAGCQWALDDLETALADSTQGQAPAFSSRRTPPHAPPRLPHDSRRSPIRPRRKRRHTLASGFRALRTTHPEPVGIRKIEDLRHLHTLVSRAYGRVPAVAVQRTGSPCPGRSWLTRRGLRARGGDPRARSLHQW
jgi:hypothetical protein